MTARAKTAPLAVVVVPGIFGSDLVSQKPGKHGATRETTVYSSSWRWTLTTLLGAALRRGALLQLPQAGGVEIRVKGLAPARRGSIPLLPAYAGYEPLLDALGSIPGLERGHNLLAFPFDWRRSHLELSKELRDFCCQLLDRLDPSSEAKTRLVLVGHSMGGTLSALAAVAPELKPQTALVVTIGTPWSGSVNAAVMVLSGLGIPFPGAAKLTKAFGSFPGLVELAATFPAFDDGTGRRLLGQFGPFARVLSKAGGNTIALATALAADPTTAPPMAHLIGHGYRTAVSARAAGPVLKTVGTGDGDSIVPTQSARPATGLGSGGDVTLFSSSYHSNLPADPLVVRHVEELIRKLVPADS